MLYIEGSCDKQKLKKVIVASRYTMSQFTGLTAEDKEEILIDVMYRFEADCARFPVSVYVRHCRNKIIGFLGKKTAQKRMQRKVVDGKTVFIENMSLSTFTTEEENVTLEDIIPAKDESFAEVEILADVERKAPELLPIVKKALSGDRLEPKEKTLLKRVFKREDLK